MKLIYLLSLLFLVFFWKCPGRANRVARPINFVSVPPLDISVKKKKTRIYLCEVSVSLPAEGARVGKWQIWSVIGNGCLERFDGAEVNFTMPEHDHPSESVPLVSFLKQIFKIQASQVRLQMPGWWQMELIFLQKKVSSDSVVFDFVAVP